MILVDPNDEIPVASILPFCSRAVNAAPRGTHLDQMLKEMQSSRSHLYFIVASQAGYARDVRPLRPGPATYVTARADSRCMLRPRPVAYVTPAARYVCTLLCRASPRHHRCSQTEARPGGFGKKLPQVDHVVGIVTMEDLIEELISKVRSRPVGHGL